MRFVVAVGLHVRVRVLIRWDMRDFVFNGLKIAVCRTGERVSGDIAIVGDFLYPIDLVAEAKGKENRIAEICDVSGKADLTLVCGAEITALGKRRLSAIVAHRGRLVDVADGCSVSSPYVASGTIKIYRTKSVKFAVLLGGDARVAFIMKKVAPVCDFVVALEPEPSAGSATRVRYLAAKLSLPVLYVSPDETFFAAAPYGS